MPALTASIRVWDTHLKAKALTFHFYKVRAFIMPEMVGFGCKSSQTCSQQASPAH